MIEIQLIKTLYHNLKRFMEYKDVTETVIGCAYRVYNKMGFGERKPRPPRLSSRRRAG